VLAFRSVKLAQSTRNDPAALDGNRWLGRPKTPNLSLLAHETC